MSNAYMNTPRSVSPGNAIRPARDCFAIENACTRSQLCHGLDNQGKAFGQIIAGAAVEPHPFADLAGDYPKAVMLDFVQPFIPVGWGFRASRKAWRHKTRRQSTETRRHARTEGVRKIAARFGVSPDTVQRISRPFDMANASPAA
jgi:hypothetical protein